MRARVRRARSYKQEIVQTILNVRTEKTRSFLYSQLDGYGKDSQNIAHIRTVSVITEYVENIFIIPGISAKTLTGVVKDINLTNFGLSIKEVGGKFLM